MDRQIDSSHFLFYNSGNNKINVRVIVINDTVWTSQKGMSEIFNVDRSVITKHLGNIFDSNELNENSVSANYALTAEDGKTYNTKIYNLDAIISVGYRVNSYEATQFRVWATKVLREYLIKGFAIDDDRLKQGKTLFGKDYFDELLQKVREIRASERRFYQKITDIYRDCSIDYDVNSPITQQFFATVQNKLEFAITHHTASEIIKGRADSNKPNMGLNTWSNAPDGKILKKDVSVAKNYLTEDEISELNIIVNMYLDFAELQAKRNVAMKMVDWVTRLDAFLQFNEYDILKNAGRVKAKVAKQFAEKEYSKFRVIQDREFKSDFDKVIEKVKNKQPLPIEEKKEEMSEFNQYLDKAIKNKPQKSKKY